MKREREALLWFAAWLRDIRTRWSVRKRRLSMRLLPDDGWDASLAERAHQSESLAYEFTDGPQGDDR